MNSYFFKITKEEKENILDKHKHVYDGYVTNYTQSNTQPLYVQDYANDKNGITVSNNGNVMSYTNMRINEMRHDGKSTGLFDEDAQSGSGYVPTETFESDEHFSVGKVYDMIGDGPDDMKHGTFDDKEEEILDFSIEDKGNFENSSEWERDIPDGLDMIDDGSHDLLHGTFDLSKPEMCSHCGGMGFDENSEEECEWCGGSGEEEKFSNRDDDDFIMYSDMGEEETQQIKESVNKSLDMFRRFRQY